jgi:hypothetical protein
MRLPRKAALGIVGDTMRRFSLRIHSAIVCKVASDSVQESEVTIKRLTVKGEVVLDPLLQSPEFSSTSNFIAS